MGENKINKTEVVHGVLKAVAVAGAVAMVLVAPNTAQLLKVFLPDKRKLYQRHRYYNSVLRRLLDKGLVCLTSNASGQKFVRLTVKGEKVLERYEIGSLSIPVPKRWDGKYRVIIFDIKERRRSSRDELRNWLIGLGFIRLQNSVWVFPYECQEIITLLKSHFKIGKEILYLTVDSIENDRWLKKHFGLGDL